ncbi:MAG: Na+/galactose cotransporter [Bacteroides sp. SM23_62_1]|nr:MAG: Na+/galactose cotransporter [Bacteroides sp. SM23_62_1]
MDITFNLSWLDYTIMIVYFAFVLGIGWVLKKYMRSATDFLEAGRSIPAWVAGLAFIATNLGALEVIGMAANGAKYGLMTVHFYFIGAIPGMILLGIFMMPFYYGSKARSVPEYLKLRFDEKTRGFNAISFAVMTIFASGISMYALAMLMEVLLGWNFNFSLMISAIIVLIYVYMGGLSSAIYNEVLQFFLIVIGFAPLVVLGLINIGGWDGLKEALNTTAVANGFEESAYMHSWQNTGSPDSNPMGVGWFGVAMGLGLVLGCGYWCINFLVVQRAMAANSMSAARRTPLIGAIPKMFIPYLVIIPGMIAIALTYMPDSGFQLPVKGDSFDYDKAIPMLLGKYFPTGVLGLGLTALMASFMSGMAGNVTAFNTVWTYDIYQSYINPDKSDKHYLRVGQLTTVVGVIVSIGAAYMARFFNNIMDFLQLVFAFINAPLFATFVLGMFWKRATGHGAFYGLVSGTLAAAIHHGLTSPEGSHMLIKGGWLGTVVHYYPSEMAQNFWTAVYAFTACFMITVLVSVTTKQLKTNEQLTGLVWALTPRIKEDGVPWFRSPEILAVIVGIIAIAFTIYWW